MLVTSLNPPLGSARGGAHHSCPRPISQRLLAQLHLKAAGLACGLALLGPERTPIPDAGELAALWHQK